MLPLRNFTTAARPLLRQTPTTVLRRHQSTAPAGTPTVARRGVGGVKGGLYGFLLGSTVAGIASYFYFLEEYRTTNELLTEDVNALRASVLRIETYVRSVEDKLAEQAAQARKGK